MSNERESLSMPDFNNNSSLVTDLHYVDYDIAGNVFRAYYDNTQSMIFVVDETLHPRKPNVLLVLPADGVRKWDDILANDYGIDLETIRPRKDNKYQKLDVEYNSVDSYSRLVSESQSGADLQDALSELNEFRDNAVRHNAIARLDTAQDVVLHTRETIDKTNDSVREMVSRLKDLRAKLSEQKKSIGREPTKQSAAKILRSESIIDATSEKIERARRRLANARRRLVVAEDDIAAAQNILDLLDSDSDTKNENSIPQFKEIITEPKAEKMSDEDVKPLFDKDPEILDDEIAFKPIDFGTPTVNTVTPNTQPVTEPVDTVAPSPLSFVPPQNSQYSEPVTNSGTFAPISDVPDMPASPVLDSMRPVEPVIPHNVPPVADSAITYNNSNPDSSFTAAPVNNDIAPVVRPVSPMSAVVPGARPVSPIRGADNVTTSSSADQSRFVYYVMLVLLIVLSVFTLWMYQRNNIENTPELTITTNHGTETTANADAAPVAAPVESTAFIDNSAAAQAVVPVTVEPEPVVVEPESESIVNEPEFDIVEPEPEVIAQELEVVEPTPAPLVAEPIQSEDSDDVTVSVVSSESPFLTEPVEKPEFKPIKIEPIVNKPAYSVSQQDKMFVADPEYVTDASVTNTQNIADTENAEMCADGSKPDMNGCCSGEVFTDMGNGTFACCQPVPGGECFDPMR